MATDHRTRIAGIRRFDQLVAYLRDDMGWPIESADFEDLTFDYTPEELGIDAKNAAKIQEIKRLRPLAPGQPWGIFFVKFEPKRLPVVALRRILSQVALKKQASANKAEQQAWAADDLLFISNYGEDGERRIAFAHFAKPTDKSDLPTLKVLGWDNLDTPLHLDDVADKLVHHLSWPEDTSDEKRWRARWRGAFVLRHGEVVSTSKELSVRLAELARAIRDRIKTAISIETEKGTLTKLMKAFQTTLVHDLTAEGFADMYAQTIAYGLLSSRIADPQRKTADDFAAHMRTNPFLRELMETFLKVGGRKGKKGGPGIDFDELGVSEVIELLDNANMEAVIRDFGDRNPQEDPVIHFYELFLKEYDAKKRMQRGVFYTPRPVVSFIVRSVHELLRTEFGLDDGLADTTTWGEMVLRLPDVKIPVGVSAEQDFVQILDPATGTGTFLVEAIDLIHKTLVRKWQSQGCGEKKIDALWNDYVPTHLLTRLYGYELMMAPYAIAHLKIGLKLHETGYRFGSDERARVFLTNALEPHEDYSGHFDFAIPALAHEAKTVSLFKKIGRFSVVIGNPPYSGVSANLSPAARSIIAPYRKVDGQEIKEKGALQFEKNLNDDYIKFIRYAESHIESRQGLVALITNNSFLESATLRGLRSHLLDSFSSLWFLDLHGDSDKREVTSDGKPDENVFEIKHGVSISVLVRTFEMKCTNRLQKGVTYRLDVKGSQVEKYRWLTSATQSSVPWTVILPRFPRYLFRAEDTDIAHEYESFASVVDILGVNSTGFESGRDELLTAFSKADLKSKICEFATAPVVELREKYDVSAGWGAVLLERREAIKEAMENESLYRRFLFAPFDIRWCFYRKDLLKTNSFSAGKHFFYGDNVGLIVMRQVSLDAHYSHAGVCGTIANNRCFYSTKGKASYFPIYLFAQEAELVAKAGECLGSNFSKSFRDSLSKKIGLKWVEGGRGELASSRDGLSAYHAAAYLYGILFSPVYRKRYLDFLKVDFPRIPMPVEPELFHELVPLGASLIDLHLMNSRLLDRAIAKYVGEPKPEVEKILWTAGTVWLNKSQSCGFKGVSETIWNFHFGGYQVCEKWLKDRKGRTLSQDDITHYQKMVVAISETIRLMKEIDEVIGQYGGWPGAFQTKDAASKKAKVIPFRRRPVQPTAKERYRTCVPLMPLKAAAGAFSGPQHIEDDSFEWVEVDTNHRLREGMFVSQVVGRSMEPLIPDGSYCLFRAPVEGTRQGKTVLVQLRDITDPETSQRFTVKRYKSDKANDGDSWRHERITLEPLNPDFKPIVMTDAEEGSVQVVAELVEVLAERSD
jgi:type I restriction-modification system DNA methylase subunit/SOS-response transcriptional repressor LexA